MAGGALFSSAILVSILSLLETTSAHYTPTWAVHVPDGKEAADAVARDHGFVNLGEIFDNHYHFHHHAIAKRSLSPAHEHHLKLHTDSRVRWAKQQRALSRKKRDFQIISDISSTAETASDISSASKRDANSKRELQPSRVKGRPRAADAKFQLNDPKWPHMWYLNRGGGLDMNVIPAWREGITGRGVVVTILDDGLETDHPDLIANYDPMASYDVNSHDSDPQPRYDMIDSNRHGTRCAGEVAATANNSLCAVGVAYGASVGGVRMLDGDVTDAVEARSLSLNPQHVDIYSASWGPDDDGKTVDGPGELATRAFIEGVTKGRNGKGSIFVWASGNGGREHDNCNCDGYTNSIWTLSISSATERGEVPWYSEMCSSTLAATYSSGAINEKQVVTTDLHHSCTAGHTGTSASAPLAAGICALALQANRDLTWRDMQHIVVRTARPERLSIGGEWRVNGVGRNVSHSFGYGLLDAAGMVRLAKTWRKVPAQRRCELAAPRPQRAVPARSSVTLQLDVVACPGVNYLEHVQARVSLSAARRGDLRIALTSPAGTKVTLLAPRPHDSSRAGFNSWPFMSVHMWGESPLGNWQLEVTNEGRYMAGPLTQWELIFYGTETPPQEYDASPETKTNSLGTGAILANDAVGADADTSAGVGPGPGASRSGPAWSGANEPDSTEEGHHNSLADDLTLVSWHSHTENFTWLKTAFFLLELLTSDADEQLRSEENPVNATSSAENNNMTITYKEDSINVTSSKTHNNTIPKEDNTVNATLSAENNNNKIPNEQNTLYATLREEHNKKIITIENTTTNSNADIEPNSITKPNKEPTTDPDTNLKYLNTTKLIQKNTTSTKVGLEHDSNTTYYDNKTTINVNVNTSSRTDLEHFYNVKPFQENSTESGTGLQQSNNTIPNKQTPACPTSLIKNEDNAVTSNEKLPKKVIFNYYDNLVTKDYKSANAHDEQLNNEFEIFGKSIAAQLKKMPIDTAIEAQMYIQNYLSELRLKIIQYSTDNTHLGDRPTKT